MSFLSDARQLEVPFLSILGRDFDHIFRQFVSDKNSLPKSPTELEKVGLTFSGLFSLVCACARGDIATLRIQIW